MLVVYKSYKQYIIENSTKTIKKYLYIKNVFIKLYTENTRKDK